MTGVEDHHVGAFRPVRRRIAQRRQQIRHPGGVIGIHLAAIGFDEELLHGSFNARLRRGWPVYRVLGQQIQGFQAATRPCSASDTPLWITCWARSARVLRSISSRLKGGWNWTTTSNGPARIAS